MNVLIWTVLKRLGILSYLNFRLSLGSLRLPIIGGIGLEHFEYEHEPWLTPWLKMLLRVDPVRSSMWVLTLGKP